jgi:putative membrane protein
MTDTQKLRWNPPVLGGAFIVSAVLALSWFTPGPWRDAWDWIDKSVFFSLNGKLDDNPPMATFLALANARAFDLVPAWIFLALFWRYMTRGGPAERTLERVTGCGFMVVYVLVATQILDRIILDFARHSPSLVLEPAHRISEMVTWMHTKDASTQSFPGNHGTVSIMFSICLVQCFGRRAVFWGIGLVLLSIFPRLIAGTYWLTDVAVGSLLLSLPPLAVAFATPLHAKLAEGTAALIRRWMPWAESLAMGLFSAQTPPLVAKGLCMGSADIIPGVSGGTMAYILGIYQRLLEAITIFNPRWFRHLASFQLKRAISEIPFLFLAPLGFGILLAVWIFTKMIPLPYFVHHHPEPVYGLFFGLVAGSVVLLVRQHARLNLKHGLTIAAGIALGISIVSLVPANTPDATWFIFLCGALAISAMLLPGISGSFILLILGKYALILAAIGDVNLRILIPFALGCGVGLLAFAHSLKWLMTRHPVTMNLLITGLLIGTLRAVWPFQERTYAEVNGKEKLITSIPFWPESAAWISLAGVLMLAGFAIIFALDRLSRGKCS